MRKEWSARIAGRDSSPKEYKTFSTAWILQTFRTYLVDIYHRLVINSTLCEKYDVAMFEPSIPGFVLSNAQKDKDKVLQSVEVEVATAYAPGPRPIAYSPPNYDDESLAKETGETRFLQFN